MTAKDSIRSKFTNEAQDLQKDIFSVGGAMSSSKKLDGISQSEVDAMLGGFDFAGLEQLTTVKTAAVALPKVELKPAAEPVARAAAQPAVEAVAAVEPVREAPAQQVASSEVAEGHSFSHFFSRDDNEQPAASNRSNVEMFA